MKFSSTRLALLWAWRSMTFYRTRSLSTIVSIGLATALLASTLGFQAGYEKSLKKNIDAMGYQVLVTGKGCPHEAASLMLRGGAIPMYIQEEVFAHIESQPEVDQATRFFMQSVPSERKGASQLYVGIDEMFLALKPGAELLLGEWFSSMEADEAILGYNVAEYLRLKIGDTMEIQRRIIVVQGILQKLGTQDDGTIFLPITTSQALFERRDRLTGIGIRLHDIAQAALFVERMYEIPSIQVVRMSQVQTRMLTILEDMKGLLIGFGGFCLLIALIGTFNSAMLSAQERKPEMGVLRALGCPAGSLFRLIWTESLALGLAGVSLGAVTSLVTRGAVEWFVRTGLRFAPSGMVLDVSPMLLVLTCGFVVVLCLAAGFYPALRSAIVPPMQSIRSAG